MKKNNLTITKQYSIYFLDYIIMYIDILTICNVVCLPGNKGGIIVNWDFK